MGLRFIYGTAGTGKSTFCFNEIKEKIKDSEKIYVITPEQFSYSAEKKLLQTLGKNASVNAEVISFNRMATRVIQEVGGTNNILISKSSKVMLIYSILENEKKNLKYLNSSTENVDLVIKEITEMKKHNITTKMLSDGLLKIESITLKEKLQDINYIYKIYENYIEKKYIDEEDLLTKLYQKLPESKMFDNSIVYIDEFAGFTKQEYNIITEIIRKAKEVNITICTDDLNEDSEKETDIFYFNKNVKKLLTNCAQIVDKKIEKPIFLKNKYRFKNNELLHLEESYSSKKNYKYQEKNNNIKLLISKNPYTEMEHVAQEILELVREKQYRFNDIAIITNNIEEINNIAKAVFSKYNIPIFIDEKNEITDNVTIKYILSILEIFVTNWSTDAVFNYIKSGFLDIDDKDIYQLENYCTKMGINRYKWYGQNWMQFEELRKKIVNPLMDLKEKINKESTAKNISKVIYQHVTGIDIKNKIDGKIKFLQDIGQEEIAQTYIRSINCFIDVLDEIVEIFGDEKISIEKYKDILKVGLKSSKIGKIPQNIDQVILGNVDRSKSHQAKAAFIIGMNDGIFPKVNKNQGFFNDNDRDILKSNNLEIANGTLDNLYEEEFNIYKALSIAEEKIYLSYCSSGKDGSSLRPSVIILKLKKIFPNLKEESDIIKSNFKISNPEATFQELLKNIRKMYNGESIDDIWIDVYNWYISQKDWKEKLNLSLRGLNYTNKAEKISKENIEKLYGNEFYGSISRLEQYRNCPFSFHLKYGLKIKEEEHYEISSLNTGSFMHDVVQVYFDRTDAINLSEEERNSIIDSIVNEKLKLEKNYIFMSSTKFAFLTNKLKKAIKESIKYIVYQIKSSDFEILGNEIEFSQKIGNANIYGKIDRVDIGKDKDSEYIRIIDYKSSGHDIDLNEVMAGISIQLVTYMDAISSKTNKEPAGMLYFQLMEPILSKNKNLSDEEIEKEIRKSFKMNGLILADVKVIKMMDKTVQSKSSDIVPAYITEKGELSASKSKVIQKEDFSNLQKTIKKVIEQIANEILSGNININPIYSKKNKKNGCTYCKYKTICAFDPKVNQYKYIEHRTKELILDSIKSEVNK